MSRTWHSRKPRKRIICGMCRARKEKCQHLEAYDFGVRVHDSIAKRHCHRGRAFGNKLPYVLVKPLSTGGVWWRLDHDWATATIPMDDPSTT